jgi:hypothetical protein
MVNWKEVERLRSKGWDWASIAEEKRVEFAAPDGVEDPGRALKALYLQRKSKRSRSSRGAPIDGEEGEEAPAGALRNRRLFWLGTFLACAAAVWTLIAFLVPAPFAIYVPVVPDLLILLFAGLALVVFVFVTGLPDVRRAWWKPAVAGVAVGLVLVGALGGFAYEQGYAYLHPAQPISGSWSYAANEAWTGNGKPVVLFVGSEACPFCSASSWALLVALQNFASPVPGGFSGWSTTTSSPTDTFANTPEAAFAGSTLSSQYLSWDAQDNPDNQHIAIPALPRTEQSYLTAYDNTQSIPFVVVDGIYISVGTLLSPQLFCVGQSASGSPAECTSGVYTPAQVLGEIRNQSGPLWSGAGGVPGIESAVWSLEAYFTKADQLQGITPPSSLPNQGQIDALVAQIPSP